MNMVGYAARADTADFAHNISGGGWVDDGNTVRLETSTDSVGIGTSSPSEKLDVVGNMLVSGKATIGSGHTNTGANAFVAGLNNSVSNTASVISGGSGNTASGAYSTIGGGWYDTTKADFAGVFSGYSNLAGNGPEDTAAFVGGGFDNSAVARGATVGGGYENTSSQEYTTIGGGLSNISSGDYATVAGGNLNTASSGGSTVAGGGYNVAHSAYSAIGGGAFNKARGLFSVVSGGGGSAPPDSNAALGNYSSVGGGRRNITEGIHATICGGYDNTASGAYSAILGGYYNTITSTGDYSYLFGAGSSLSEDSTFMVDMPHVRFGDEITGYEFPVSDGTNGQVMATDGSGQLTWTAVSGGGGGWADDGTVIRLETNTDSVGIGTITPTEKLDVAGTAQVTGIKMPTGASNGYVLTSDWRRLGRRWNCC
jgi:hypothetical protein